MMVGKPFVRVPLLWLPGRALLLPIAAWRWPRPASPDGHGEPGNASRPRPSSRRTTPQLTTVRVDRRRRQEPAVDRSSVIRLILNANPMLWPLAFCSVVTLGYVLERLLALRRERVIPREFADRFLERLSSGKLDRERPSSCARHTRARRHGSSRWWSERGGSRARPSGRRQLRRRR